MSQKKSKKTHRGQYQVILHNDNHNTFDHVINCLIDVCGHNYYQAVQCATLTHGAKRCSIFVDSYESCENVYEELLKDGLSVTVTKVDKHDKMV